MTGANAVRAIVPALFLALQAALLFFARVDTLVAESSPNAVPSPGLTGDVRLGQTFLSPAAGLARLDVLLGTYGRANSRDIFFRLWESGPPRRLAAEVVFNASEVRNNLYRTIRFAPEPGSKNRTYLFEFVSPDSTPGDSIAVWMNASDVYRAGEFFYGGRAAGGDLTFRAYARRPVRAGLPGLTRGLPGFLGTPVAAVAVVLLFELCAVLFLLKILETPRQR